MRPPTVRLLVAVTLATTLAAAATRAQTPAPSPQIAIGATVAQRQQAARALVPLLKDVRTHAQTGPTVKPGTVPNSPFAGTQTTLFAFTFSKRSVPVDLRVVTAMNQLLDWNIGASGNEHLTQLFDRWLIELEARSTGAMRLSGGGLCDVNCVVKRMTTLDETWGSSPRDRGDTRDELLLEALKVAVLEK